MNQELYKYYDRELRFFRQLAPEFARQHPGEAGMLFLEPATGVSTDPHVERLIQAFALLTGRVHHKLDDEFPELTDALFGILYPHYVSPAPSMAIVQFEVDPVRAQLPNGFLIERHSRLHSDPIRPYSSEEPLPCRFRTGYPVTLWPLAVTSARWQSPPFTGGLQPPADPDVSAALRLQIECVGELKFADLSLDKLRFYLCGDNQLIADLYELIFNHTIQVAFRPLEKGTTARPVTFKPEQCVRPVGFEREESLLPYPKQSFLGYRLLTEFFTFPSKFLFFDLAGWDAVRHGGFGKKVEVVLWLNRSQATLEQGVDAQTFRLGCTPVVNLFDKVAEPISLTQARYEYRIKPEVAHPRGMEVYSIDEVNSTDPTTGKTTEYQPFYSFRHGLTRDNYQAFWYASRKPSLIEGDRGTEVYLNLVDLRFDPQLPADSTLVVQTTCTNRDLPLQLQRLGEELRLELEAQAPLGRIRCLRTPTPTLRPPLRRGRYWRLISHLSLNHLSIADPDEGCKVMQEILRLYDFSDPESAQQLSKVNQQLIDGVVSVNSRRVVGRVSGRSPMAPASGFCRGIEVTVEFDEQKYVGTGAYLFACVLERFLGQYASINSFSQMIGRIKQSEGVIKKWPPRAGEMPLL